MLKKTTYKTIIFDLDGTLLDSAPDLINSTNFTLQHYGYPTCPDNQLRGLTGMGSIALLKRGLDYHQISHDDEIINAMRPLFLKHYQDNMTAHSTLYPDAFQFLEMCQQHQIDMGICTNKPDFLTVPLLSQLNINHFFKAVTCPEQTPNSKPHPDHVETSLAACQAEKSSTLFLGDSSADYFAATDAGIDVLIFKHGYNDEKLPKLDEKNWISDFKSLAKHIFSGIL